MTTRAAAPQAMYWDQPDADGTLRRTYRASGRGCPICAAAALEPRLEDADLLSGRLLDSELACDGCGALYAIANSDPLELRRIDRPAPGPPTPRQGDPS